MSQMSSKNVVQHDVLENTGCEDASCACSAAMNNSAWANLLVHG
jgi:hypothetical protein